MAQTKKTREEKKLKKLQEELDNKKWADSTLIKGDTCGIYTYCKYCDKYQDYPCARAKNAEDNL